MYKITNGSVDSVFIKPEKEILSAKILNKGYCNCEVRKWKDMRLTPHVFILTWYTKDKGKGALCKVNMWVVCIYKKIRYFENMVVL